MVTGVIGCDQLDEMEMRPGIPQSLGFALTVSDQATPPIGRAIYVILSNIYAAVSNFRECKNYKTLTSLAQHSISHEDEKSANSKICRVVRTGAASSASGSA